jgi:hypothetical protein
LTAPDPKLRVRAELTAYIEAGLASAAESIAYLGPRVLRHSTLLVALRSRLASMPLIAGFALIIITDQ